MTCDFKFFDKIMFQHERWYLELNPRGEVPVLLHGDQVIVDSNVILEVKLSLFQFTVFYLVQITKIVF